MVKYTYKSINLHLYIYICTYIYIYTCLIVRSLHLVSCCVDNSNDGSCDTVSTIEKNLGKSRRADPCIDDVYMEVCGIPKSCGTPLHHRSHGHDFVLTHDDWGFSMAPTSGPMANYCRIPQKGYYLYT